MITADAFIGPAIARGFDFYTGVPCSFLTPIINRAIGHPGVDFVGAANEGEAVAIAAGAWLAGRKTVVMCQNSGLGNAVNPLTSLNFPFRIPVLMIVTWRGQPGHEDEPQHDKMGRITAALLDTMGIGHGPFPRREAEVAGALDAAAAEIDRSGRPVALIMAKGSVRDDGLDPPPVEKIAPGTYEDLRTGGERPPRIAALERVLAVAPDAAAIIATTGKTGRELFTLADRAQHLYQVGSMGCASAMGLGLALNTARPVVVLDGDGAALMHLGNFATIGACRPANLVHILLDNGVHDSTGGQATVSSSVDFAAVARGCGYRQAYTCDDLSGFEQAARAAFAGDGPSLVRILITPGSIANLGRPTVTPAEVAQRFKAFIAGPGP